MDARYYRADGESQFVKPHSQRFATPNQLLGEGELRAAAVRRGAPAWTTEDADAVVARFARAGRELSADQATALRGILTSGAAVEVLNAPAGTGKSFLVGTLADTWPLTGRPLDQADPTGATDSPAAPPSGEPPATLGGDGPRVFGVAYGQRQADVLAEEGVTARNIRRWLDGQDRLDAGRGSGDDETFRLRRGDLLVVDEAGAASTPDLVAIHRRCEAAGAKLLLVGDQKQLAAVGAGGALADIAERGIEYQLAEVRRFTEAWEGPASLRLRDGDTSVLHEYAKHGRLVDAGSVEQAEQAAAPRLAGRHPRRPRRAASSSAPTPPPPGCPTSCAPSWSASAASQEQGVPLGHGPDPLGVARHRRRGRRPRPGPPQRLAPRRLGRQHRGPDQPPDLPRHRRPPRRRADRRPRHRPRRRTAPRRWPTRSSCPPPTCATRSPSPTRRRCTPRTAAPSTPATASSAPAPTRPAAYVQATRGRDTNVAVRRHPAHRRHRSTPARPPAPPAARAAEVLADVIRPPEVDPNRTALAQAEQAAEEARVDRDPRRPAGHRDRRPHRRPHPAVARRARRHRPAARPPPGRARRRRRPHDPGPAAAHGRAGRPRPRPRPGRRRHRERRWTGDVGGAGAALPHPHRPRRPARTRSVAGYADLLPRRPRPSRPGTASHDPRRRPPTSGAPSSAPGSPRTPPQWAREALGAVPDADADPDGRAEWEQRAGWAAPTASWSATRPRRRRSAPPRRRAGGEGAPCSAPRTPPSTCPTSAPTRNGMSEGRLRARGRRLGTRTTRRAPLRRRRPGSHPRRPPRRAQHRRHDLARPRRHRARPAGSRRAAPPPPARPPSGPSGSPPRIERAGRTPTTPGPRLPRRLRRDPRPRRTRPRRRRPTRHRPRRPLRPGHRPGMARRPPRRPTRRRTRPRHHRGRHQPGRRRAPTAARRRARASRRRPRQAGRAGPARAAPSRPIGVGCRPRTRPRPRSTAPSRCCARSPNASRPNRPPRRTPPSWSPRTTAARRTRPPSRLRPRHRRHRRRRRGHRRRRDVRTCGLTCRASAPLAGRPVTQRLPPGRRPADSPTAAGTRAPRDGPTRRRAGRESRPAAYATAPAGPRPGRQLRARVDRRPPHSGTTVGSPTGLGGPGCSRNGCHRSTCPPSRTASTTTCPVGSASAPGSSSATHRSWCSHTTSSRRRAGQRTRHAHQRPSRPRRRRRGRTAGTTGSPRTAAPGDPPAREPAGASAHRRPAGQRPCRAGCLSDRVDDVLHFRRYGHVGSSSASRPARPRPPVTRRRQCARRHRQFWTVHVDGRKTPGAPPRTPALPPAGRQRRTQRKGVGWAVAPPSPGRPEGMPHRRRGARQNRTPCTPAAGAALLRTPDRRRSRFGPISGDGVCCRRGCRHCTP